MGQPMAKSPRSSKGMTRRVTSVMMPVVPSASLMRSRSLPVNSLTVPVASTARAETTLSRNRPDSSGPNRLPLGKAIPPRWRMDSCWGRGGAWYFQLLKLPFKLLPDDPRLNPDGARLRVRSQHLGHAEEIHHHPLVHRQDPAISRGALTAGGEGDAVHHRPAHQGDQFLLRGGLDGLQSGSVLPTRGVTRGGMAAISWLYILRSLRSNVTRRPKRVSSFCIVRFIADLPRNNSHRH